MNIEYIDSDCQDSPLILIYGWNTAAVGRLVKAFRDMADGKSVGCDVRKVLGVGGPVHLLACVSKRNIGVAQTSLAGFEWRLTAATWDNVTGLLEPFSWDSEKPEGHRHQYLNDAASDNTCVIVSTDRSW